LIGAELLRKLSFGHAEERLRAAERLLARPDLAANLERTDKDYVASCRRAEQAAQARARRGKAVLGALLALLGSGGVAWWQHEYLQDRLNWFATVRPYMRVQIQPYVLKAEAERVLKPGDAFRECAKDCPEMIVVPDGEFTMGSPDKENTRDDSQRPQHRVIFAKPFAVSKFEVTFEQWDACVAIHRCDPIVSDGGFGRGTRPVINVSWDDAQRYVTWFSLMTGKPYRLLSEAEWEYAARAGTMTHYSFGDDTAALGDYAWYDENSGKQTHPVGEKKPNAFGLHDIYGNVDEWVEDPWHDNYQGASMDGSPWVKDGAASWYVVCGGAWLNSAQFLRACNRFWLPTDGRYDYVGFRLARTLKP
jgi:formylglycine-generating enzyme required for sulfatase activity